MEFGVVIFLLCRASNLFAFSDGMVHKCPLTRGDISFFAGYWKLDWAKRGRLTEYWSDSKPRKKTIEEKGV